MRRHRDDPCRAQPVSVLLAVRDAPHRHVRRHRVRVEASRLGQDVEPDVGQQARRLDEGVEVTTPVHADGDDVPVAGHLRVGAVVRGVDREGNRHDPFGVDAVIGEDPDLVAAEHQDAVDAGGVLQDPLPRRGRARPQLLRPPAGERHERRVPHRPPPPGTQPRGERALALEEGQDGVGPGRLAGRPHGSVDGEPAAVLHDVPDPAVQTVAGGVHPDQLEPVTVQVLRTVRERVGRGPAPDDTSPSLVPVLEEPQDSHRHASGE